ncbi:hypothetical protein F4813DRAFT_384074 [Daldinia decipiens]|uniref:uncharacterized protein n=1 Tax=Daldinia decipiens TaxID=326647 RepID=UPI0020C3B861|nr:uncharacterized protein F4813DRAFT_384074 [Daldinia decipiens]KAI1652389.1 hypothetical protein F4813DRAFT_384074 [Daldinia decipiens]
MDAPTEHFESILKSKGLCWTSIRVADGLKTSLLGAWGPDGATTGVAQEQMKKVFRGMIDAYMESKYDEKCDISNLAFQSVFLRAIKDKVLWVRSLSDRELSELIYLFIEARDQCLKRRRQEKFHPTTQDSEVARLVQQFVDLCNHCISTREQPYAGPELELANMSDIIPFSSASQFVIGNDGHMKHGKLPDKTTNQHYVGSNKGPFLVPQKRKSNRPSNNQKPKAQGEQDFDFISNLALRPKSD